MSYTTDLLDQKFEELTERLTNAMNVNFQKFFEQQAAIFQALHIKIPNDVEFMPLVAKRIIDDNMDDVINNELLEVVEDNFGEDMIAQIVEDRAIIELHDETAIEEPTINQISQDQDISCPLSVVKNVEQYVFDESPKRREPIFESRILVIPHASVNFSVKDEDEYYILEALENFVKLKDSTLIEKQFSKLKQVPQAWVLNATGFKGGTLDICITLQL